MAVWADVLLSPVIISKLPASGELDESSLGSPGVFPVCAVMCAQSHKGSALDPPVLGCSNMVLDEHVVLLPDLPPSVMKEDWSHEEPKG